MSTFDTPNEAWLPQRRDQRVSIAPILIGVVLAAAVIVARSPVAAWLRGFLSKQPGAVNKRGLGLLDSGRSPAQIRHILLGRGKSAIAAAFGAPRTAGGSRAGSGNFWNADTWYYPIDSISRTAMSVRFESGIAREVEFFDAPQFDA